MCNKAVESCSHALEFVPDCYEAQIMRDKTANTYPSTMELVCQCCKTQEICNKAVNKCLFVFDCIPDQYKTQEMCGDVVYNIY